MNNRYSTFDSRGELLTQRHDAEEAPGTYGRRDTEGRDCARCGELVDPYVGECGDCGPLSPQTELGRCSACGVATALIDGACISCLSEVSLIDD